MESVHSCGEDGILLLCFVIKILKYFFKEEGEKSRANSVSIQKKCRLIQHLLAQLVRCAACFSSCFVFHSIGIVKKLIPRNRFFSELVKWQNETEYIKWMQDVVWFRSITKINFQTEDILGSDAVCNYCHACRCLAEIFHWNNYYGHFPLYYCILDKWST